MNQQVNTSKKSHWFTTYQEGLIKDIKTREETEKKELNCERGALKILDNLPEELLHLCLEFIDEKFKKKHNITKITNLLKKYVGGIDKLKTVDYEDYPIYKLMQNIPDKVLLKFIKCGTPSRYFQKIMNHKLFSVYKNKRSFYETIVELYKGEQDLLSNNICAWEITKLIRFSFKAIIIEGEELYDTDYKKYKEYILYFKNYEKYTVRLLNSIVYLHNKYI